jgi:hypothetical protein
MKTSVSIWHLLLGEVQLGTLEIQNGRSGTTSAKGKVKTLPPF